jgi:peptidoglycan/xylan/chitin deacetylase (PgdA/CDA1 family)
MTTTSDSRLTVCLTFDFDAMSAWIGFNKSNNPTTISRGEFGAIAVTRILPLLERQNVKATFYVPGHTALAYPGLVRRIAAEGHEIGHHGWVHENPAEFDLAGERAVFAKGLEALDRVAGVRPVGYRSPGCDFSPNTIDILLENGIVYDASHLATDFSAYYLRQGNAWSLTDPYVFGTPVDLVAIPFAWGLDDFPHFELNPGFATEQKAPSAVREIWQDEFDFAYDEVQGGVYDLCMHPQVIGRGSRLRMLEGLIEYMKSRDGVVFERMIDYVERWKTNNPLDVWTKENAWRLGGEPIDAETRRSTT